jgi:hypothetical protein
MRIVLFVFLLSVSAAPLAGQIHTPASGTAWDPAAALHPALHAHNGAWDLRLHADATIYRADEGSVRGNEQWGSTNWLMAIAARQTAGGTLVLRGMMSLEPLTVRGCGTPNLLQTGEVCDGEAIVDAQHPHELFSEIALAYSRLLGRGVAADLYVAAVGEPALGPVAFPHRTTARSNPISPITHHWIDATHVAFGVVTAGIEGRRWRFEGSAFNGREPDDERYDFDFAPLHSWSARLQLAPTERVVLQASAGRLRNAHRHVVLLPPELDCPPVPTGSSLVAAHGGCHLIDQGDLFLDLVRTTASASYHHPLGDSRSWSVTAAWGRNNEQAHVDTDGVLLEGRAELDWGTLFARAERVTKSDHELAIRPTLVQFMKGEQETYDLGKLVVGYALEIAGAGGIVASVGGAASWSRLPAALEQRYGTRTATGLMLFASFRPVEAPGR